MEELLEMMLADLKEKQKVVDATDRIARDYGWGLVELCQKQERERLAAQIVVINRYIAEIKYQQSKNLKENLGE